MPQITVIIPTYSRPNLISRAIKSVLNQTYQDFELIIIDSGPDNKTEEAVKLFQDERIKYIHNKEKTNAAASRNQGVKQSSVLSKYIAFLDDDDEFLPKFLEKTVKVLQEDDNLTMATSNLEMRTRDGKKIRQSSGAKDVWEQGIGCGCVVRKEMFIKENFWYDERLEIMEDPDLGFRVLRGHKWNKIPEVLWAYYLYPNPAEKTLCTRPSLESLKSIELFFDKNHQAFGQLSKKALGFLHFRTGKVFLRMGVVKKAREHLFSAFLIYPCFLYFFHYLLSFVDLAFPGFSANPKLRIIKQKVFKK